MSTLLKSQKGYRRLCRLRFTEKKESVLNLGTERLLQVLYSHPVVHISTVHSHITISIPFLIQPCFCSIISLKPGTSWSMVAVIRKVTSTWMGRYKELCRNHNPPVFCMSLYFPGTPTLTSHLRIPILTKRDHTSSGFYAFTGPDGNGLHSALVYLSALRHSASLLKLYKAHPAHIPELVDTNRNWTQSGKLIYFRT